jgi:hypothetical protein
LPESSSSHLNHRGLPSADSAGPHSQRGAIKPKTGVKSRFGVQIPGFGT